MYIYSHGLPRGLKMADLTIVYSQFDVVHIIAIRALLK